MGIPDLRPSLPIGAAEPRIDRIGDRTLTEDDGMALVSLASRRGREADLRSRCETLLGAGLPPPGTLKEAGPWLAFWTGPEQWMLMTPVYERREAVELIETPVSDAGSIVDQTDGMARFTLDGARLDEMLTRLCDIDVDRMGDGEAHRTVVERVGVILLVHSREMMTFLSPRSYAGSLYETLVATAKATEL